MNVIDIVLLIVIMLSMLNGWRKGFIIGMADLFGWITGILAAVYFYKPFANFIDARITPLGVWSAPVAFVVLLCSTMLIMTLLTNRLMRPVSPDTHYHGLNRGLGLLPGFVSGVINATILAAVLLTLPLTDTISDKTRESGIARRMAVHVEWMDEKLSPVFDDALNSTMVRKPTRPGKGETVDLRFRVANPKVRGDLEARMLEMVNAERAKHGLKPLKADPELAVVARKHSRDMFSRGYFSHVNPEGKTPGDRIRQDGVKFMVAGENLALGQTLRICHEGLMNSPGHRANILHTSYGRLGIGVLDGGIYGLMITQNFRN